MRLRPELSEEEGRLEELRFDEDKLEEERLLVLKLFVPRPPAFRLLGAVLIEPRLLALRLLALRGWWWLLLGAELSCEPVLMLLAPWLELVLLLLLNDAFNALGEFKEELSPPSGASGNPWKVVADVGLCSAPRGVALFIPNEFKLLSGAGRRPASGLSPLSIDICPVTSSSRVAICQPCASEVCVWDGGRCEQAHLGGSGSRVDLGETSQKRHPKW